MKRLRGKLTYSNVISTLCLFLLLGGGAAYAASHLGKNSVGTKQLKKSSVTAAKLATGAVSSTKLGAGAVASGNLAAGAVGTEKLSDASITSAKILDGQVQASDVANGAIGTTKVQDGSISSPKIKDGEVLASDLGPLTLRSGAQVALGEGSGNRGAAFCAAGERAISGGAETLGISGFGLVMVDSYPLTNGGQGWEVGYINPTKNTLSFEPFVYCLAGSH